MSSASGWTSNPVAKFADGRAGLPVTMTNQLSDVREALTLAEQCALSFSTTTVVNDLDSVTFTGTAALSDLSLPDLSALVDGGHLVDLRVRAGEWSLQLRRGGYDGDVTESDGPLSAAVDQNYLDDLSAALAADDFSGILGLLQAHDSQVTLRVINDPDKTGTHWIASHEAINGAVSSLLWVPFARALASGPADLVVEDLGDAVLATAAIAVHGPESPETAGPPGKTSRANPSSELDESFRRARAGQKEPYPSPLLFAGLTHTHGADTPAVATVSTTFDTLAYLLTWALLASSSRPIKGGVHVAISGARELDIDVHPALHPETGPLLDMYRWVAMSPEIDRLYYVQQALTLAVVDVADVHTAAAPALRTARSLYELSRRNSVAEVMAARRSAREIALAASRSAATQARESSAKTVERTVLQLIAATGVIIAQLQKALSPWQSAGLLATLGALCVLFALVTDCVTLRSARSGLDSELEDLDQYRDSLSTEDVTEIKTAGTIAAAKSDLSRARWVAWLTNGIAGVILVVVASCVLTQAGFWSDDHIAPPRPIPSTAKAQPSR